MLKKYSSSVVFTFALILLSAVASPTFSQIQIPAEAIQHDRIVKQVIQEGTQLEAQHRWGEAISFYENAIKKNGSTNSLSSRLKNARIRFDLERRLADKSYLQAIQEATPQQTLGTFGEVLLKIESFHVETPDWNALAMQGIENTDIALQDPRYRSIFKIHLTEQQVLSARRELQQLAQLNIVRTRADAYRQAASVSSAMTKWGIPAECIVYEYVCGAVCSLDWYSGFLTTAQYTDVMSQIEGNFVGLGFELRPQKEFLEVVGVIPSGPAGKAGLSRGDHIVQVDRKTVTSLSGEKAADLLRGEENSFVHIAVERNGQNLQHLNLQRRRVEIPSVEEARIIDQSSGVAYIKLTNFQRTTRSEFLTALWKLYNDGMQTLIVDLRGNPGGLLDASVDLADLFLNGGTIVSTQGRNPHEDQIRRAHSTGTWQVPLTVLIDGNSASASEIFAGAIHDHQRGTIVGRQSYGKGSVQGIFPLNLSREGLRLTTAKFYSPNGTAISRRGVTPDVVVQVTAKPALTDNGQQMTTSQDAILSAGIQTAVGKIQQR